ncbi:FAD-dependent oxidoreductase [Variovorax sp. PBL-E5]|uniref:FAD-dependent oxidoreductase n=1 Tax=Variovorax sp. PBL-E5 TaxID=434014 RepID=UPI001319014F|nr:FAD-dependent oxidoreductase [Variovorax sp. PBL-E5]VTU28085.1 ribulose-1,5-biphosphate synthetase [Variovorax sp. PBL-E5]
MSRIGDWIQEPAHDVRVAAEADVVVVGGGPAGLAAAYGAARNGARVTLLERYNHLGGLASGGMVLVLDDMWDSHLREISVRGTCMEMIDRMAALGLAAFPKSHEWGSAPASIDKWLRWGTFDFHSKEKPHPICFAAAFDPDAWKRVSMEKVKELGIELRLHSWFSRTLVEDGKVKGVICDTKQGREAILGGVVIDTTGDLDVAASAGAPHVGGSYIMTTVFRLGGVDTDEAERFEREEPEAFEEIDREIKRLLGGSWAQWWLKTPLPGVVWCNCPHMPGLDGLKVDDLTRAEVNGRKAIHEAVSVIRARLPGFRNCFVVDLAPQTGVRQTRLLEGEYVMTKDDVMHRARFADSIARGRDYYYPYRTLVPRSVDNLLVAGRHYSATSAAQKISREIPPCMAMGEAAGVAAALALDAGVAVRDVDVAALQRTLRAQGADPGDQGGPNADVPPLALAAQREVTA